MKWYLNDASLQGQFSEIPSFEAILQALIAARVRVERLRRDFRITRSLTERLVGPGITLRRMVQQSRHRDLRAAVLAWLDRTGPFIDDDRQEEANDYFEWCGLDVTESGLGEAARRVKSGQSAVTFSFPGGVHCFEFTPLAVDHGLQEERYGIYDIENVWTISDLTASALSKGRAILSWQALVEAARERFHI